MGPLSPYPQAGVHSTALVPSSPAQSRLCSLRGELAGWGALPASPGPADSVPLPQQEALYMKGRELTPQLSQNSVLSLADSHTEFFDACEVLLSASSSENEVREAGSWQAELGARRV